MVIENYQWKVLLLNIFPDSIYPGINENKYGFHSYISGDNEKDTYDSHAPIFHILKNL